MMTPTNGEGKNGGGGDMLAMEMESLRPGSTTVRKAQSPHPLSQLWLLIKLYIESYPAVSSTLGFLVLGFFVYVTFELSRPSLTRHTMHYDYTSIDMDYNFQAAQMDHWCLFGDDTSCPCEDFTEPVPREENAGWVEAHEANKRLYVPDFYYDVVFLGDDLVELWNNREYNRPVGELGAQIASVFNHTFNRSGGGGKVDGVALGIAGDSSSNLLWRIKHGELAYKLKAKVWWISIGMNDLARGGCSEEATVLGILRTAEEVAANNPGDDVVIQGILPRTSRKDGSLVPRPERKHLFGKTHSKQHNAEKAREEYLLWPSIVAINEKLAEFCEKHGKIIFFDASDLFVGTVGNKKYHSNRQYLLNELMQSNNYLPSLKGNEVLLTSIADEVQNIVLDEDETNDIEKKDDGN